MPNLNEAIAALEKILKEIHTMVSDSDIRYVEQLAEQALTILRAIAAEREQPGLRPGLVSAAGIICPICADEGPPDWIAGDWRHGELYCHAPEIQQALCALPEPQAGHRYTSTYCFHGSHGECRLECKVCQAPCECACHVKAEVPHG